jgi:hypothetical protein
METTLKADEIYAMSPEAGTGLPLTTNDEERVSHESEADSTIESAERIERPPAEEEGIKPQYKIYPPLSFAVLALLAPASILGTLARLGLLAMTRYDGQSIFSLAYVQALGCLIMGFALRLKEPIGQL